MANAERYGMNQKPALGLVKGLGLKSGAIASSVAHDSHNLMVVGKTSEDMALSGECSNKSWWWTMCC